MVGTQNVFSENTYQVKKKKFSVAAQSHLALTCYAWVHSKSNIGL